METSFPESSFQCATLLIIRKVFLVMSDLYLSCCMYGFDFAGREQKLFPFSLQKLYLAEGYFVPFPPLNILHANLFCDSHFFSLLHYYVSPVLPLSKHSIPVQKCSGQNWTMYSPLRPFQCWGEVIIQDLFPLIYPRIIVDVFTEVWWSLLVWQLLLWSTRVLPCPFLQTF